MSKANNIYRNSRAIQSSSTVASSLALSQGDDDLDNLPSDARANTQANAFSEYGICRPANATYPMSLKSFYSEIDEDAHWSNRDHATAAETKAPEHQLLDWKNHPTKKFDTIPGTDTPDLFDRYAIPSQKQLADAAEMYLDDENGEKVRFGDIVAGQTTIVLFIRTTLCGFCQSFMKMISEVNPKPLENQKIRLVAITMSSWHTLKVYKRQVNANFQIYTNPDLQLYAALQMTLKTTSTSDTSGFNDEQLSTFMLGLSTARGFFNGLLQFSPGVSYGDLSQLGGDFIFENKPKGEPLSCVWASRMTGMDDHAKPTTICKRAVRFADQAPQVHVYSNSSSPRPSRNDIKDISPFVEAQNAKTAAPDLVVATSPAKAGQDQPSASSSTTNSPTPPTPQDPVIPLSQASANDDGENKRSSILGQPAGARPELRNSLSFSGSKQKLRNLFGLRAS